MPRNSPEDPFLESPSLEIPTLSNGDNTLGETNRERLERYYNATNQTNTQTHKIN